MACWIACLVICIVQKIKEYKDTDLYVLNKNDQEEFLILAHLTITDDKGMACWIVVLVV